MGQITTIESLIDALDNSSESDRAQIVADLNLETEELEKFATWSDECYTRNCIARSAEYEIILLCWDAGAVTPIHGHDGQDCWVYQVQGDVLEMRFKAKSKDRLMLSEKLILKAGDFSYMTDEMGYHLIKNDGKGKAMTLHIYAGPIDECEVFCDEDQMFKLTELEYDSVAEEYVTSS